MQAQGPQPRPEKETPTVQTTEDEIREKYLERAIRELNDLGHDLATCADCPRTEGSNPLGGPRHSASGRGVGGTAAFAGAARAANAAATSGQGTVR